MNLKDKKVLVTGSEGFIGSHLVERLVNEGAKVKAFVLYNSFNDWGWLESLPKDILSNIEIVTGNISEAYNVKKAAENIDVIFHLAALIAIPYSYHSPESYVSTNVSGTLNILQAARECGVKKVVHTSTSETYGTAIYTPIDEKHPLQGQSPYSASKIGADMMAESFYRSFELPVAICRPFNTYGPRQSARAVIPTIISQLASGSKKLKLGSLSPVRDLTYVSDTVDGFIKIAMSDNSIGQVLNLGTGSGVTIGDLAKKIMNIMDLDVEIVTDEQRLRPEKSEVKNLISDNSKAKSLVGWTPQVSIDEGLNRTVSFVRENLNKYKPDIYNK